MFAGVAMAQEVTQPDAGLNLAIPEGAVVPLDAGTRAPFAGMLIRDADLTTWRLLLERAQFRLRLFDERAAAVLELNVERERVSIRAAEARNALHEELWRQRVGELTTALNDARVSAMRGWWEHPALWFAVGVVLASVGVVAVGVVLR
jgi:hypothetical protein